MHLILHNETGAKNILGLYLTVLLIWNTNVQWITEQALLAKIK
jgi:hypothetical protein